MNLIDPPEGLSQGIISLSGISLIIISMLLILEISLKFSTLSVCLTTWTELITMIPNGSIFAINIKY